MQESISFSFTPYLGQWLNLHPSHRHSYSGLLKFGLFPQGLHNYSGLFTSVFDLANQQGLLDGVPVWDAYSKTTRPMALEFLFDHEDSQGVQKVLGSCGVGSKKGGCPWCTVDGVIVYPWSTNCYYPSAIRCLSTNDPLRAEYKREFSNNLDLVAIADAPFPTAMTTEEAIASAERVQQKISSQQDEYYSFVSPFYSHFGTDVVNNTTFDPCHAIGKTIEHLLCLIFTTGHCQMTFTDAQKEYEMGELGRWDDGFPFRASVSSRNRLQELLQVLPKPKAWSRIHHLVHKPTTTKVILYYMYKSTKYVLTYTLIQQNTSDVLLIYLDTTTYNRCTPIYINTSTYNKCTNIHLTTQSKLDEALQVGGCIGKYMIGQLEMDDSYKSAFVDLLDCFDKIQAKLPMSDQEKSECQNKLVRTLAWLEIKLPVYWCTIVRHLLLHIIPKMDTFGSMWAMGMLTMERNHKNIKAAVRSTQVIMFLLLVYANAHMMYQHTFICHSTKIYH